MQTKTVAAEVLAALSSAEIDGVILRLTGQLDRKLYLETNTILEAMGGKWDRKAKGHVFAESPVDALDQLLLTGEIAVPRDYNFFPTPPRLARHLVDLAEIEPDHLCMEPSAGQGAIADEVARIVPKLRIACIEILPANVRVLEEKGYAVIPDDFLNQLPAPAFDRVVMNPPFTRQQDIDHVHHAWEFLKPEGRLVSVMAAGVTFRQDRKAQEFRRLIDNFGWWDANDQGAFRESGTEVNTVTVILDKPG